MRYFTTNCPILMILGVFLFPMGVIANPSIITIGIEPVEPTPLSAIIFTVTIDNTTNIQDVRLILQECQGDMCFVDKWNESMNFTNDVYHASIKLLHEQATQFKYNIAIKANETWFTSETAFVNLSIDEQNNPPEDNPGNNSTPGFELVLLFFSTGLILIRRRKLKEKNK